MFNPTYLQRSRHGIYYFRWTLPPCKRTARPASSIRLSLRTREPRQALQLAMPLSYLARSITGRGVERGMDFKQLRTVLTDHFSRFLAARKAQIDETGPLSEADRMLMENTASVAEMELADGAISRDGAEALVIRSDHKLNSTDVTDVLSDLFILRGVPEHIRSNNGPEFIARAVQDCIAAVGTKTA